MRFAHRYAVEAECYVSITVSVLVSPTILEDDWYEVDPQTRTIELTERGVIAIEQMAVDALDNGQYDCMDDVELSSVNDMTVWDGEENDAVEPHDIPQEHIVD